MVLLFVLFQLCSYCLFWLQCWQVCNTCMGVQDGTQPCVSLDCPVLFRRHMATLDLSRADYHREALLKQLSFWACIVLFVLLWHASPICSSYTSDFVLHDITVFFPGLAHAYVAEIKCCLWGTYLIICILGVLFLQGNIQGNTVTLKWSFVSQILNTSRKWSSSIKNFRQTNVHCRKQSSGYQDVSYSH